MTGFIVKARYQPKMDEKREQRIHAAFERCDVKVSRFALPSVIEDDAVQVHFSDVGLGSERGRHRNPARDLRRRRISRHSCRFRATGLRYGRRYGACGMTVIVERVAV